MHTIESKREKNVYRWHNVLRWMQHRENNEWFYWLQTNRFISRLSIKWIIRIEWFVCTEYEHGVQRTGRVIKFDTLITLSLSLAICPQCNERSCVLFFSSDSNYLWPNSRNKTKTFEILKIRCDDLVSMVHATARTPNNKTPNLVTPNSKENKENTFAFRGMWAQLG